MCLRIRSRPESTSMPTDRRILWRSQAAADSHKGTYGKILVIAGAKNMAGAAYFSALGAVPDRELGW